MLKILPTERRLTLEEMFALREYPRDIVPVYTEGHSLASFLIARGGKRTFARFLKEGMSSDVRRISGQALSHGESAKRLLAVRRHYGFESLDELEAAWLAWVYGEGLFFATYGDAFSTIADKTAVSVPAEPAGD